MLSFLMNLLCRILGCEQKDPRPYCWDHHVTCLNRKGFQILNTRTDYTRVPDYDTLPISRPNSTSFVTRTIVIIPWIQSPISSVASNFPHTSSTLSVAKPKTETPQRYPQPQFSCIANSTTPSVAKPKTETPKRHPQPQVSCIANTTTPSVAKPKIETPKRHPRPQVSYIANTTTPSVAKPKIETPKRHPQPQVSDANSTTDQKLTHKSSPKPAPVSSSKPAPSVPGPPPSSSRPDLSAASSSSSFGVPQFSFKPIISQAPSNPTVPQTKTNYVWVEKGATPLYMIPEDIKGLIQKDIVPGVLKKPLSRSTYTDYFAALLYAEDYYLEKWDGFKMEAVSLQLHDAAIYGWKSKNKHFNRSDGKDKIFVAFEIDSVPERRPFLRSRDFAFVRPSGTEVEPFQGIIYRMVKRNLVLVEFGEDFHSYHYSSCEYDVKFSFNRVCLKRAHQAIAAASDVLFKNFLFPERVPKTHLFPTEVFVNHKLDGDQVIAVRQILSIQGPPPYLVEGPLSVTNGKERDNSKQLSRTGVVVREAVLQICRTSPSSRILICAPLNSTCDMLMRSLQTEIQESDMFRANAAFREIDGVPLDILPSCLYKGECFSCPSLQELKKYKVILSTFMSSFRLCGVGIVAGHFSHVFLVDASCATEPETMVPLANLANERTAVVITGAPRSHSGWVRSNIARQNGLMTSYFERLRESKAYESLDPKYITQLKDVGQKSDDIYNSRSFY